MCQTKKGLIVDAVTHNSVSIAALLAVIMTAGVLFVSVSSSNAEEARRKNADAKRSSQSVPVVVSGHIMLTGETSGMLIITAHIKKGWHIYSTTQKQTESGNGPRATQLLFAPSDEYCIEESLKTNSKIDIRRVSLWPELELEELKGQATWRAKLRFKKGIDPTTIVVNGKIISVAESAQVGVPVQEKLRITVQANKQDKTPASQDKRDVKKGKKR